VALLDQAALAQVRQTPGGDVSIYTHVGGEFGTGHHHAGGVDAPESVQHLSHLLGALANGDELNRSLMASVWVSAAGEGAHAIG